MIISPNPAHNFIQLYVTSNKTSALFTITNSAGNVVMQQHLSLNNKLQTQLNVSNLLPGIYTATIVTGNHIVSRQFIKE